ncbi:MAG: aminodeoxychorismate/anthranilate synthase component II [Planctomycetota bacterium]
MTPRILVLDHRDSFVFNLVDAFARRGCEVRTLRAELSPAQLDAQLNTFVPHLVVLSPGPGHPRAATTTLTFLRTSPRVPVLGVCLGLQAMALAVGGRVEPAPEPVHGRATQIRVLEDDDPLFADLPRTLSVGRYHSLMVTALPSTLRVLATTDDDHALPMAVRHRSLPWLGLQFHPESVLTAWGDLLLQRALTQAMAHPHAPTATPDLPATSNRDAT